MKKKNLYLIDYKNNYDIDDLINNNVDSLAKLVKYCLKTNRDIKVDFDLFNIGCSCFSCLNSNSENIQGRNFDYLDASPVIIWTFPKNGYKSVSITDSTMLLHLNKLDKRFFIDRYKVAPFMPMDGINEKGLSVAIIHIYAKQTNQKTNKRVIITTTAIRLLLDKASNVDEAIKLLKEYDMKDMIKDGTYHFLISDSSNNSVVVEYIDNKMHIVTKEEFDNKYMCVTNFYLNKNGDNSKSNGIDRFNTMKDYLDMNNGKISDIDALKLLNRTHKRCHHRYLPTYVTTIYSALYNLNNLNILLCANQEYKTIYKIDLDKPAKYEILKENALIENYKAFKD